MIVTHCIDPGVHGCALAAFGEDKILFGLTDTETWQWGPIHNDSVIVVEIPRADKDPRKSNDLIDLNGAGMRLVGQIEAYTQGRCKVVRCMARNSAAGRGWKGQLPKPIHHSQLIKRLTPAELAIVQGRYTPRRSDPATVTEYVTSACARLATSHEWRAWYTNKIHNSLDAVALGFTHFKRM